MSRSSLAALTLFAFAGAPSGAVAASTPGLSGLDVVTASGPHHFEVELAGTDAEREKGLMFRKTMAADHGMLFDFKREQPVAFWMKNTFLPLDMVFIRRDGTVASVARDAVPMSEAQIPSDGPVLGVLEVNAGVAARIGLKAGDRVEGAMFGR